MLVVCLNDYLVSCLVVYCLLVALFGWFNLRYFKLISCLVLWVGSVFLLLLVFVGEMSVVLCVCVLFLLGVSGCFVYLLLICGCVCACLLSC